MGLLSKYETPNQRFHELLDLQNEPKLIDSSAPLFSMYNKREKEHDEKMTENWKGDAEGILVFVRENSFLSAAGYKYRVLDWFVLSSRCTTPRKLASEPSVKSSKCFSLLSWSHISAHPRFKCVVHPLRRSNHLRTTYICHMGQHALVPQPCGQSHLCAASHSITTVGTSVSAYYSEAERSTETCADPRTHVTGARQTNTS